ncbi:MAG: hypothetical protein ACTS3R_20740 [Inquilinaceae bacterium]
MFRRLFSRKSFRGQPGRLIIIHLNARLQPLDRGTFFEDPLDLWLKDKKLGEVTGGGTALNPDSRAIVSCDVEVRLADASERVLHMVTGALERLGAPKGSHLTLEGSGEERPLGHFEGLAVFLNGTDLLPEVYQSTSPAFIMEEFYRLMGADRCVLSQWHGPTETAIYMYGASFATMHARIGDFLASYPLFEKSRVEQIV